VSGISTTRNGIAEFLDSMLSNAQNQKAAFARIYPLYQKLQAKRFQTENASEGEKWPSLNPVYAKYKRVRFGGGARRDGGSWNSYPGTGSKMMIATSTLAGAVIGPGEHKFFGTDRHRAMFESDQMTIAVEESGQNQDGQAFTYPHIVAETRPFMSFSSESTNLMKRTLMKYILNKG